MLETVELDRMVTFDMQPAGSDQAAGFFNSVGVTSVTSVQADSIVDSIATELATAGVDDESQRLVIVANHSYCITMAQLLQSKLKERLKCSVTLGIIMRTEVGAMEKEPVPKKAPESTSKIGTAFLKRRHSVSIHVGGDHVEVMGDVRGNNVLVVDDILDTGTSLERASRILNANGASKMFFMANHALLSADATTKMRNSFFEKILVADTSMLSPEKEAASKAKLVRLPIAPLVSDLIKDLHYIPKK